LVNVLFIVDFFVSAHAAGRPLTTEGNLGGEISDLALGDAEMQCAGGACHVFLSFVL
jgi:hypothetical protein